MKLPAEARGRLAAALLTSLDNDDAAEIERQWIDEAERRYRDHRAGRTKSIPTGIAIAEARL
jgi:putative addiction module component (TIGR02574 family)